MPRFFINAGQRDGELVRIRGGDAAHLARAQRVRPGERLTVVEDGVREHTLEVERVSRDAVDARVLATRTASGDPRLRVHVLQALPQQGMDACVESLALAGAASVRPVITARVIRRPDAVRAAARVERWRVIAREAAQLAGRAWPPEVHDVQPLGDALAALPSGCPILACVIAPDSVPLAMHAVDSEEVALVIGPEGGLDANEVTDLRDRGATCVHLGERALPSRIAGLVALTLLLAASGDLAEPHR